MPTTCVQITQPEQTRPAYTTAAQSGFNLSSEADRVGSKLFPGPISFSPKSEGKKIMLGLGRQIVWITQY